VSTAGIRVLVVEDHPVYRDGLTAAFTGVDDMRVIGAVGTVAEALDVLGSTPVDVALVDLGLPDGSGLDVVAAIRSRPGSAALILTMNDDRALVLQALRAGATGYLLKGASRSEIVDAVRTTAAGGAVFAALPAEVVLAAASGAQSDPVAALGLTVREGEVLRLLAEGLTNQEIARRLFLAPKTVRNQVSVILGKLGAEDRAGAARRARAAGI
jgi:DNA-binding NarL/FixJ family response regulator